MTYQQPPTPQKKGDELGVLTTTARVCVDGDGRGGVWLVPLLAWYHSSWDTEPDITNPPLPPVELVAADFRRCRWTGVLDPSTESVAAYFDTLNDDGRLIFDRGSGGNDGVGSGSSGSSGIDADTGCSKSGGSADGGSADGGGDDGGASNAVGGDEGGDGGGPVTLGDDADSTIPLISFSHYLPKQELLPEKRNLTYPHLSKMVGSRFLANRLDALRSVRSGGSSLMILFFSFIL